ncbi:MAG: hypothetical protein V1858_01760 [Candidatus Gottesmanbacteria bacterium]
MPNTLEQLPNCFTHGSCSNPESNPYGVSRFVQIRDGRCASKCPVVSCDRQLPSAKPEPMAPATAQ